MTADRPSSENARLAALESYNALDTPLEPSFDRITRILSNALNVPMVAVSLIDGHRQWLKSSQGDLSPEVCRGDSFCNVTIQSSEPMIVEDATLDARFKDHALVQGEPHIRFYAGVPLRTPSGYNLGSLCAIDTKPRHLDAAQIAVLKDLAEVVMGEFEARRLALKDNLTGTLTRAGFLDEAERAHSLAARHGYPLACIAFDLDHFVDINDTRDTATGDNILREVAAICKKRLRASDILARIGGDEFIVILPHTDATAASQIAEAIRTSISQRDVAQSGSASVTASFGVAARDPAMLEVSLDELLHRAHASLSAAKKAGGNTCVAWGLTSPAIANIRRVFKAGQIVFNSGRSAVDCTVRGPGESAAYLDVVSTAGIPDTFKLAIADDHFSRACSISSKHDKRIEVAFV